MNRSQYPLSATRGRHNRCPTPDSGGQLDPFAIWGFESGARYSRRSPQAGSPRVEKLLPIPGLVVRIDAVRRALEITPPELASDIVDRGIVMAGGGAMIRGLDVLLSQETSLPVRLDDDPLTCVVRGTGRILDDPEKYQAVLST